MNGMDHVKISLIFLTFFRLLSMTNTETGEARDALVQFMEKLSPGADKKREANWGWNTSSDPCKDGWKGVTCYKNSPNVKQIELDELDLTGLLDAASLCTTKALTVLSLNSNKVVGTLPQDISKCSRLTRIYLHGNNMSGPLPASLSRLGNLKRLDVSDNGFSGDIPDVSRISGLLTFLAQNNQFTGVLPSLDFSNLEDFNVSNNKLSGPIPDVRGYIDETSFLGNPELCGKPLSKACPPPHPAKGKRSLKKDYFIYGGYAVIGLIIACLVAFKLIKKRKDEVEKNGAKEGFQTDNTQDKMSSRSSEFTAGGGNRSEFSLTSVESGKRSTSLVVLSSPLANKLRFEDLLRSPAELIGRGRHGTLYKVVVCEGSILAVKRIRDWDISMDDFKTRMQRIDRVKHQNVMPILAFYCSRQEKLIVYEFQQNGSLFSLLQGSQNGESFGWGARFSIAARISEALAFMHEGLLADGIAHGNIKSSNILLNTEMVPCISEYGLAEVELQDQSFLDQTDSFQENNLHGAVAPNKAFKTDTYRFGIILLELLTGKPVQNNGYDLARWVNSAIREESTVELFDRTLVSEGANEEQMVSLLQVALKCINSSSEARPSIREVAEMIESIEEKHVSI